MPGRPRKNRMKAQSKNNSQVFRLGRKMTCTNCQETGHNKSSCKKEPVPKPPKVPIPPALRTVYGTHASVRVRGRGSRGGRCAFGGRGEGSENMGESSTTG
ncbi:calcium/proton exchanger, partial [Tanacetum coccineum]